MSQIARSPATANVALNQYTWANRTRKHYIYMLQTPMNILKELSTPKLSSQQHVKYVSNLMNFVFSFLNPKVLKCREDLIALET